MQIEVKFNGHDLSMLSDDGNATKAVLKRKFWRNHWTLFDNKLGGREATFSIKTKIPFIILDYEMSVYYQSEGRIRYLSLRYKEKKPHIVFYHDSAEYLIVFHRRYRISLFKNGTQFGSISKKQVTIDSVQVFNIISENHIDLSFLRLLICVVIITLYSGPEEADFSIIVGEHLTTELMPFNPSWAPRAQLS